MGAESILSSAMHSGKQNAATRYTGPHYIELIGKTVAILEVLHDHPDGLSLQRIAEKTGQIKSSAHRILRSLIHHGYIEQDAPGGAYRLGIQCLVLARRVRVATSLVELARPYSRDLCESFGESTYIAVLRDGRGVFLDVQETKRDLRLVGPLGAEVHFHATAAGKAMAAYFPKNRAEQFLAGFRREFLTKRTLVSRSQVEREWAAVRRLGYAVNDEETIQGAIFLAAPVFDAKRMICASISIGLPKPRYSRKLGERIAARLKETCRRLSEALEATGYVHENAFGD